MKKALLLTLSLLTLTANSALAQDWHSNPWTDLASFSSAGNTVASFQSPRVSMVVAPDQAVLMRSNEDGSVSSASAEGQVAEGALQRLKEAAPQNGFLEIRVKEGSNSENAGALLKLEDLQIEEHKL